MANPVGTMFVELDMDTSKYTKAQKEILTAAHQSSLDIETNFKRLGGTSDAMYQAMRQKAENAYAGIANSAKSSANEIRRAQEALHAKITSLNEQQFGAQATLLERMKGNWIAATAAVTAAYLAASKMWDLADKAAAYAENVETLNFLTSQYNITGQQMVKTISENSDGLIDLATAAKISADALAKGFKPEQLAEMAKWAPIIDDFSASVGSSREAFETLVSSMAAGRERGVTQLLGATIDLKEAFGEQAEQMSKAEKATALYNLVAQRMIEIQKTGVGSTDSMSDAMDRLKNQFDDPKLTVGDFIIRAGAGLMAMFQSLAELATVFASALLAPVFALMKVTDYLGITKGKADEVKIAMDALAMSAEDLGKKAASNFGLWRRGCRPERNWRRAQVPSGSGTRLAGRERKILRWSEGSVKWQRCTPRRARSTTTPSLTRWG